MTHRGDYFVHPFMIRRRGAMGYVTKTALCYLKVGIRPSGKGEECFIRVKIGSTVEVLPKAVEGQLFSSTYSIECLDNLVDELHSSGDTSGGEKDKGIPGIINWAEIGGQGRSRYVVYMIYTKIGEDVPWVITSFTNKHVSNGLRLGFLAILPRKYGSLIRDYCLRNERELILEIER